MKKELLNQFLSQTYTTFQIRSRLFFLRSYINSNVFGSNQGVAANKQDQQWFDSLPENFKQTLSSKASNQLLIELTKQTEQLKPVVLVLPFDLPEEEIFKLGGWLRQIFNLLLVYEVKYDPSLIGGCALIWNGVYHDYSIKHKIQMQQEQLLSSFKGFLK